MSKSIINNKNSLTIFISIFILCFVLILFLSSSLFSIKEIYINNNDNLENKSILENQLKLDLENVIEKYYSQNIFALSKNKFVKDLEFNPFIKSAKLDKKYPNTLYVTIQLRTPIAYIEMKNIGNYALIDSDGIIISIETMTQKSLPVISGLELSSYIIGQAVKVENEKTLKDAISISELLRIYEIENVLKIDIINEHETNITIGKVDVIFGDVNEANEKVSIIKESIVALNERIAEPRGFLDVSNTKIDPIFKHLK